MGRRGGNRPRNPNYTARAGHRAQPPAHAPPENAISLEGAYAMPKKKQREREHRGRPRGTENPLSHWIDRAGLSRQDAADKLGVERVHLDRLCRDRRTPSLELAFKIEHLTRGAIQAESWLGRRVKGD